VQSSGTAVSNSCWQPLHWLQQCCFCCCSDVLLLLLLVLLLLLLQYNNCDLCCVLHLLAIVLATLLTSSFALQFSYVHPRQQPQAVAAGATAAAAAASALKPATCHGYRSQLFQMLLLLHCTKSLTCTPFSCISAISSNSPGTCTTTPLPITFMAFLRCPKDHSNKLIV
jgi:hypothetical protein